MNPRIRTLSRGWHIIGFVRVTQIEEIYRKAIKFGKRVTVCRSVWGRLGKYWRERLCFDYFYKPKVIRSELIRMNNNGIYITDIQQLLFARHGVKLRITTLIRWICQSRGRKIFVWG